VLTLPGPVVDADWLQAHHSDPDLRIVDARWSLTPSAGRERYAAGHLPGAIFLDIDHDLSSPGDGPGRHPLPAPARLERVLGNAGIGDRHMVVAYDDAGGSTAARVWWLFRHFGHADRVAVLDGGLDAWTRAGGELVTDVPQHAPATWNAGRARDDVVDAAAVAGNGALLLDARAAERYRGEVEPIDPRAGHIPGAVSAPFTDNLRPDGRFLDAATLRERYRSLGADRQPTIAYCGSGVTAAQLLLAMEVAGIEGGRLYEGSWSDWSSDPARPAALGPRP
jgi:thiosulfate/3-mercaptopyruvate sulfurtransferase